MIPNAEEFLDNYIKKENIPWNQDIEKLYGAINAAMIEFAKLHVTQALNAVYEKGVNDLTEWCGDPYTGEGSDYLNRDKVLNSYPLTLVK